MSSRRSPRRASRNSRWSGRGRPWRKAAPRPPRVYAQSALGGGSPDAARYLAMIASRAAVLEPGWTPDLGATGPAFRAMHGAAVRGRILHVVSRALPYHQVGYTLRSQSVGESQVAAGLEPHFATIGNFPANVGVTDAPRDGRCAACRTTASPRGSPTTASTTGGDGERRGARELVEHVRPAVLHPASNHLQARSRWHSPSRSGSRSFTRSVASSRRRGRRTRNATRMPRAGPSATRRSARPSPASWPPRTRWSRCPRRCGSRSSPAAACAENVVVIPNAVDVERFRPIPRSDQLAARLGIGPDELVVGYISTFTAYEGIRYLIEAAAALRARGRRSGSCSSVTAATARPSWSWPTASASTMARWSCPGAFRTTTCRPGTRSSTCSSSRGPPTVSRPS